MHAYRTHTCGQLRKADVGQTVRLSGWVNRRRDHGGLIFIDLRDHYGITQCVIEPDAAAFAAGGYGPLGMGADLDGQGGGAHARDGEQGPADRRSGAAHREAARCRAGPRNCRCRCSATMDYPEETRLTYRFLDLRRERLHKNIMLRANIVTSLRRRMIEQGFTEFQTPILTASSPEGARDFLVPSRRYPGQFYALPQAPQQFKQLIMVAGFDRYFQIAPCFRDEDGRADRSPGEFYQLDLEMSFVTQDDVFAAVEPVLAGVFEEFAGGKTVTKPPFLRIPLRRGDAEIRHRQAGPAQSRSRSSMCSDVFGRADVEFKAFKNKTVRAIPAPGAAPQPRSFFDKLNEWARGEGAAGLGYIEFEEEGGALVGKGPIAKFIPGRRAGRHGQGRQGQGGRCPVLRRRQDRPRRQPGRPGAHPHRPRAEPDPGQANTSSAGSSISPCMSGTRTRRRSTSPTIPSRCRNIDREKFLALDKDDKDTILGLKAYQYDIVCNGYELSSGAIRNHDPDVMLKAFEIAGYAREETEEKFEGMLNAFRHGAPPHGGTAPGIDRIVMLLAGEENLREVTMFPMTQQAQDLLMNAPSAANAKQLKELHLRVVYPEK